MKVESVVNIDKMIAIAVKRTKEDILNKHTSNLVTLFKKMKKKKNNLIKLEVIYEFSEYKTIESFD